MSRFQGGPSTFGSAAASGATIKSQTDDGNYGANNNAAGRVEYRITDTAGTCNSLVGTAFARFAHSPARTLFPRHARPGPRTDQRTQPGSAKNRVERERSQHPGRTGTADRICRVAPVRLSWCPCLTGAADEQTIACCRYPAVFERSRRTHGGAGRDQKRPALASIAASRHPWQEPH